FISTLSVKNSQRFDTIRYDTIRYDTIRYDTIRYDTIRYDTIRYDTIRYELSSIYMRRDEHILDFIDRIKDLCQVICDEERYRLHELTEDQLKKIDEYMTSRLTIIPDTCEDLLNVKARKFYVEIELDRLRYQEYRQSRNLRDRPTIFNRNKTGNRDRNTRSINSNPPSTSCTYCNKLGHNKNECHKRK
ncbi:hypothetical protein V1477_006247, partial [Vespula maculifrons]